MSKPFKGTINIDIRDSVPDWAPFEPPKAPDGAPSVVYIVLDDVGFSAMSCYGGPIETPNIDRIAADGRPLHAVAHHGAVLADPFVPADRAQPHPQLDGVHHRGRGRVPERERDDPAGERHASRDPRRAGLEHLHGGQVAPVPDRRDERRVDPAELAVRPRVRALVRVPGRRDQPVVSGPGLRQPPGGPAEVARRRATTSPRTSPTRRSSSSRTPRRSRRTSRSSCTTRPAPRTRRTRSRKEWADRFKGQFDMGYEAMREQTLARQKEMGIVPADTELPPINPIGTPRPARAPTVSRSRRWTSPGRGTR